MQYGINIGYIAKFTGMAKAAEYVAKAGFTMLDYTPPLMRDDWETVMKESLKNFQENGLTVHQTHAPFNRYGRYGDKYKICLDRCIEATEYMGAKYVAVHGDEFDFDNMEFSPETALRYNHDLFLPCVKRGEKQGFKMAFETVFQDLARGTRFTSDPDDLLKLIKSFDSDAAVCCWDTGHANVSFRDTVCENIKKFGSLIQCTHIHDNTGVDAHAVPLTGDIEWEPVMKAFKKIGYNGVMNIEYSHGNIPDYLAEDFLNFSFKTLNHLWNIK